MQGKADGTKEGAGRRAKGGRARLSADHLPLRPGSYTAAELAELERRERLGGWVVLFFAGAALAIAVLAFYIFSDDVEQNGEYIRADRDEPVEGDDTPFVWGQVNAPPEQTSTTDNAAVEQPAALPGPDTKRSQSPENTVGQTLVFPPPPETSTMPTFSGPRAGSVDRETARALRSGKAQLWSEDGQRGYVLVSAAVTYDLRECRQISYTLFDEGRQLTSPSTQWCRLGRSKKWRPDPRGPE